MNLDDIDDAPARIRDLLQEHGIALKKRWGQNFMISRRARERVVAELSPQPDETVWEIGPGLGGITALLVGRAREVVVFEVDHGLMTILDQRFGDAVRIVAGDAVKTLVEEAGRADRIVGNLPYRSAAAIVTSILETPRVLAAARRLVFTVQREVAHRMVAEPGSSDYSPFSVLCAISTAARLAGTLSPGNFYPAPDVVSSIVTMEPYDDVDPEIQRLCTVAARSLFAHRRKTIGNNASQLASALGLDRDEVRRLIERAGIRLSARAEEIAPGEYLSLARLLRRR